MADNAAAEAEGRELGEQYVDLVYRAAVRQMGGEGRGAEDVTQAVFLLAIRKARAGGLPEEERMAGWLLKVTGFAVKETRRAAGRRRRYEALAAAERSEAVEPESHGEELAEALDEALLGLAAVDREVVVRRYLRGEPVVQVAKTVGMSESAAGSRIARALEKLRKILGRRGVMVPAAGLTTLLVAESARAAPAGLMVGAASGASVAAVSIAKGAAVMMKVAAIKMTAAAVCVLLMLAIGVVIVVKVSVGTDATVAVTMPGDSASTAPMASTGKATAPAIQTLPQFSISGELPQAGAYALAPGMKLRAAIELSHYAGDGKGLTAMIVRTVNKERMLLPMDLSKVMDGKDAGESDVKLKDGDLVDVRLTEIPRTPLFNIIDDIPGYGGSYLWKPGMKLRTAITELSHYKGDGKGKSLMIFRTIDKETVLLPPVDLAKVLDKNDTSGSDMEIVKGDNIFFESTEKAKVEFRDWRPSKEAVRITDGGGAGKQGEIDIQGEVARPGAYHIGEHRISVRQAVFAAGIEPEDASHLVVEVTNAKAKPSAGVLYLNPFSDLLGGEVPDYYLQPDDVLKVKWVE